MAILGQQQAQGPPPEQAAQPAPQPQGGILGGGQMPAAPGMPMAHPGGEEVDPQQVDDFMELAYRVLYGGDSPEGEINTDIAELLRSGLEGGEAADPVGALASTGATVGAKVLASGRDAGTNFDGAAAFAGMTQVVEELANVAEVEGIYDYSQEELDAAAVRATEDFWRAGKDTGAFPQEEMQRDAAMMQSGEMDPMLAEMGEL